MTRIYVGNLSYKAEDRDVRNAFERYGRVTQVHMMTDPMTGRSRGFAFVNMPHIEDADEAITRLNGSSICGRNITVNEARDRDREHSTVPSREQSRWDLI